LSEVGPFPGLRLFCIDVSPRPLPLSGPSQIFSAPDTGCDRVPLTFPRCPISECVGLVFFICPFPRLLFFDFGDPQFPMRSPTQIKSPSPFSPSPPSDSAYSLVPYPFPWRRTYFSLCRRRDAYRSSFAVSSPCRSCCSPNFLFVSSFFPPLFSNSVSPYPEL